MKDARGSPVRRVAKEEVRTWALVAVAVVLWLGVHSWG